MKPYGRERNIKGSGAWKKDHHPGKGWINWWETMADLLPRTTIKKNWKREVEEEKDGRVA